MDANITITPDTLQSLAYVLTRCGWDQVGGRLLRDANGTANGRTTWIPREPWWHERPDGMTEDDAMHVVRAALTAKRKLTAKQLRQLAFLLNVAAEAATIPDSERVPTLSAA